MLAAAVAAVVAVAPRLLCLAPPHPAASCPLLACPAPQPLNRPPPAPAPPQGLRKPAAESYQVVTSTLGLAPRDLIFVDDRRANVDAAAAQGWGAHHFTGAAGLEEALRARGLEF
jgi:hypothetical protein